MECVKHSAYSSQIRKLANEGISEITVGILRPFMLYGWRVGHDVVLAEKGYLSNNLTFVKKRSFKPRFEEFNHSFVRFAIRAISKRVGLG